MTQISLRLPANTVKKLNEISDREGKNRLALIRDLLDRGIREREIDHAVDLYRRGDATGWRAAQIAGVSLWSFYRLLGQKGVQIQYTEEDLERDLEALIYP